MKLNPALIGLLLIGGCTTQAPKPLIVPDMSKWTPCQRVAYALSEPRATADTKAVAMEVGRNNGCFGQPQPQKIQIEQTIKVQ